MRAARKANLRFEWSGTEAMVIDEERGTAHSLNTTAAAVLELCDGVAGATEIAAELAVRSGGQPDELLKYASRPSDIAATAWPTPYWPAYRSEVCARAK